MASFSLSLGVKKLGKSKIAKGAQATIVEASLSEVEGFATKKGPVSAAAVIEDFNHMLSTGDGLPMSLMVDQLGSYACDVLGPREYLIGGAAAERARADIKAFCDGGRRFAMKFLDARTDSQLGFWLAELADVNTHERFICTINLQISAEGYLDRFVLLSNRVV